jgi:cytochrome c oxidase assembly protein subunit 15
MQAVTIEPDEDSKQDAAKPLRRWLLLVASLIFMMILLGGATRLTDSGLSITLWDLIMGVIPPLTSDDWNRTFDLYKQSGEYKLQNYGMSLEAFKSIFWWEWSHRFFGRLIGFAFAVPFLYFFATHRISGSYAIRLLLLLLLGAAQGALGWYMVQSGLIDRVDVSHYRLAAHLLLGSLLFAATVWLALGAGVNRQGVWGWSTVVSVLLLALVLLQITAGGFVAGLDAGHVSYEWPKMNGAWIPDNLYSDKPIWKNALDNALTVQFNHRVLAYLIFMLAALHAWANFKMSSLILAYMVFLQACLGILTLWMEIRFGFALAHQATAMLVLAAAVVNVHAHSYFATAEEANVNPLSRAPVPDPQ